MARKQFPKEVTKKIIANNKKALFIGSAVALLFIVFLLSNMPRNSGGPQAPAAPTPITLPTNISRINPSSQASASATPTRTASVSATPIATKEASNSAQPVVKKLPNTSSDTLFYTVKKGDSLAKIGKKICGDKRAWISIAEENSILPPYILQLGETLSINCN